MQLKLLPMEKEDLHLDESDSKYGDRDFLVHGNGAETMVFHELIQNPK